MTQRACSSCAAAIPAGAKFCPECGAATTTGGKQAAGAAGPRKTLRDILILGGVVAVAAVAYFVIKDPAAKPVPPGSQSTGQQQDFPSHPPVGDGQPMMSGGFLDSLPKSYDSLVFFGNNFMDNQNFAMAAECYRRALSLDPSSNDVRTDYGACLHGMGLPERAIEEFRKVIGGNPQHVIATFNLGIVFNQMNQKDSARYYYNRVLALVPQGELAQAATERLKELDG